MNGQPIPRAAYRLLIATVIASFVVIQAYLSTHAKAWPSLTWANYLAAFAIGWKFFPMKFQPKPTPSNQKQMVAGFLFSEDLNHVILIQKNRPSWQAGRLNGPGGAIEHGEMPEEAMNREYFEETGIIGCKFKQFATLEGFDFRVTFFVSVCRGIYPRVPQPHKLTDERPQWYPVSVAATNSVIQNLRWLIPMAAELEGTAEDFSPKNRGTIYFTPKV